MKKIVFVLIVCVNSVYSQQRTTIKDSIVLVVLNNFIDELRLEEKEDKLVKIRLLAFDKDLNVKSVENTNIGEVTGQRIDSEYTMVYKFAIEYECNSQTIEWDPVTYYSIYRNIPVLITTGIENLLTVNENDKKELARVIKKSSSPNALPAPIVWLITVNNKEVDIIKSTDK